MIREIKLNCVKQGITIKRACELAKINPTCIYHWDNRTPSVDKVYRIAKVLNCSMEELCGGDARFRL